MADITDKDLEQQRSRVDKLREQIAAEQAKTVDTQATLHNEVEMARLKAEEARLEADLAAAKDASKKSALRDGAAVPLAQAQEDMAAAVERQRAAEKAAAATEKKVVAEEKAAEAGEDK